MNIIELQRGEQLKVIGQKSVCMILINVDGEIYSKTDSNREREDDSQHVQGLPTQKGVDSHSDNDSPVDCNIHKEIEQEMDKQWKK